MAGGRDASAENARAERHRALRGASIANPSDALTPQSAIEAEQQAVEHAPGQLRPAGAQSKSGLVIISATRPWQAAQSAWAAASASPRPQAPLGGDVAHHADEALVALRADLGGGDLAVIATSAAAGQQNTSR